MREADTIGGHTPHADWLGWRLHTGDWIVYPSEGRGQGLTRTTTQMVLAEIEEIHEDGGATVAVLRRSRTQPTRARTRLSAVGMANVTRVAAYMPVSATESHE